MRALAPPRASVVAKALPRASWIGQIISYPAWFRNWTTNGHVAIQTADRRKVRAPGALVPTDASRWTAQMLARRPKRSRAKPGRAQRGTVKIGRLHFQTEYVRIVERHFPGAVWHLPVGAHNFDPAHAVLHGETVALVMPRLP